MFNKADCHDKGSINVVHCWRADVRVGYNSLTRAGFDDHSELVRPGVIDGGVRKIDDPETNVDVAIFVDGPIVTRASCTRDRDDLKAAGIGYGKYNFQITTPNGLRDGTRRVVTVCGCQRRHPSQVRPRIAHGRRA